MVVSVAVCAFVVVSVAECAVVVVSIVAYAILSFFYRDLRFCDCFCCGSRDVVVSVAGDAFEVVYVVVHALWFSESYCFRHHGSFRGAIPPSE